MKKLLPLLLFTLFAIPTVVGATLYQYYQERGEYLPPIVERSEDAIKCGIDNYVGSYEQNEALEACLRGDTRKNTISFFNKLVPEGYLGAINFVQVQDMYLAGSGVALDATSITLNSFKYPNGDTVSMTDFGEKGFGTLEPNTVREENISFTGITQLGSGKATLTGVTRGLGLSSPYTASSTLRFPHAGGTIFRITNSAPFYNELLTKKNDETITGKVTYNVYPVFTDSTTATSSEQFVTKRYVDNVLNQGAATSTEVIAGIAELATQIEMASSTDNGVNDPLVLQAKYATSTPSAVRGLYVPVAENDGYLSQLWLDLTEGFTFSTGDITFNNGYLSNASSTVIGNFRVDGAATTTGQLNGNSLKVGTSQVVSTIGTLIDATSSDLLIESTASETTMYQFTIPAGALGTDNAIKVDIHFEDFDISSNSATATFRADYGGTDFASAMVNASSLAANIDEWDGEISVYLYNNGATNAQKGSLWFEALDPAMDATPAIGKGGHGTAAVDSASSQTLTITVQFSESNAATQIAPTFAIAELSLAR